MNYNQHVDFFSQNRMQKYLYSVDNHEEKAIMVYEANINLSKHFQPLISVFEISLRNSIDEQFKIYFKSKNWLIEQKTGFMIDPSLTYRNPFTKAIEPDNYFREKVDEAEKKLLSKKRDISHDKLMAELSLGFWIKLFGPTPVKILKGKQLMAFRSGTRLPVEEVYDILNEIRLLRNRISHHEPICFNSSDKFCIKKSISSYYKIKEALRWVGKDISEWSDRFNEIIKHFDKMLVFY